MSYPAVARPESGYITPQLIISALLVSVAALGSLLSQPPLFGVLLCVLAVAIAIHHGWGRRIMNAVRSRSIRARLERGAASVKVASLAGTAALLALTGATFVANTSALTAYTGPTTITQCGTTIDSKIIPFIELNIGNGFTDANHPCLTITNSRITGDVDDHFTSYTGCGGHVCGPIVMRSVEVADNQPNEPCVKETNYFIFDSNIHGCRTAVQCDGICDIENSTLVADRAATNQHMGAFLSNGADGAAITLNGNTLSCTTVGIADLGTGGCSGDINFYGDNSPAGHALVTNNILEGDGPSYCAYTGANQTSKPFPTGTNLVWTGNVFVRGSTTKCGWAGSGAVFDWAPNTGNVWCGNVWDTADANGSFTAGLPASTSNCAVSTTTTTGAPTTTRPATTSTSRATTSTVAPTTTRPATTTVPITSAPSTTVASPPPTTTTTVDPNVAELRKLQLEIDAYNAAHGG